jgi:hypothetical protein
MTGSAGVSLEPSTFKGSADLAVHSVQGKQSTVYFVESENAIGLENLQESSAF